MIKGGGQKNVRISSTYFKEMLKFAQYKNHILI